MKLRFIILLSLLTAGTVRGQFFFLSSSQSVSASATASVHQISSNFNYTADSGNLGGTIFLTDPGIDRYGNSNQTAYSQSLANLGTGMSPSQISVGSSVQAQSQGPYDGSGGYGWATATSVFQVSFTVSSAQMFEMTCDNFQFLQFQQDTDVFLSFSMVLSSANLGSILSWGNQPGEQFPYFTNPFFGILEPGDVYTLQDTMEARAISADPFGPPTLMQADVTLTAVPEPSTGLMPGMGVVGWLLMRLRGNSKR